MLFLILIFGFSPLNI